MRLFEFTSMQDHKHGTIAVIKPCNEDAGKIYKWCNENNIPCIDRDQLHCTVLFSSAPVEHLTKHHNKKIAVNSKIIGWKKLGNALTLELEAPTAHKIHKYMINQGGKHDYPDFIAHTSVCYKWLQQECPAVVPNFPILFDKLEIKPIDPNYGN